MKRWWIFGGLVLMGLVGTLASSCISDNSREFASYETFEAYLSGPEAMGSDLYRGCWYCGDKDGSSHFFVKRDLAANSRIRVKCGAAENLPRFDYTQDQAKWRNFDDAMLNATKPLPAPSTPAARRQP